MAWTRKAGFSGLDGKQIVDALADNDEHLLAALNAGRWHNSRFDIWTRDTTFASGASQFGPDRHRFRRAGSTGGATCSRQTGFNNARYCARVARDSGNTSGNGIYLTHQFDSEEIEDLAGATVYITADMRAGANYSPASAGAIICRVETGTGFNETVSESAGFATGNNSSSDTSQTLSTTAATKVFGPFVLSASMTELAATFAFTPSGTAGAADYFEITNIRINKDAPLLFQPAPLILEKLTCGAYYRELVASRFQFDFYPGTGVINERITADFPPMRQTPNPTIGAASGHTNVNGSYPVISAVSSSVCAVIIQNAATGRCFGSFTTAHKLDAEI